MISGSINLPTALLSTASGEAPSVSPGAVSHGEFRKTSPLPDKSQLPVRSGTSAVNGATVPALKGSAAEANALETTTAHESQTRSLWDQEFARQAERYNAESEPLNLNEVSNQGESRLSSAENFVEGGGASGHFIRGQALLAKAVAAVRQSPAAQPKEAELTDLKASKGSGNGKPQATVRRESKGAPADSGSTSGAGHSLSAHLPGMSPRPMAIPSAETQTSEKMLPTQAPLSDLAAGGGDSSRSSIASTGAVASSAAFAKDNPANRSARTVEPGADSTPASVTGSLSLRAAATMAGTSSIYPSYLSYPSISLAAESVKQPVIKLNGSIGKGVQSEASMDSSMSGIEVMHAADVQGFGVSPLATSISNPGTKPANAHRISDEEIAPQKAAAGLLTAGETRPAGVQPERTLQASSVAPKGSELTHPFTAPSGAGAAEAASHAQFVAIDAEKGAGMDPVVLPGLQTALVAAAATKEKSIPGVAHSEKANELAENHGMASSAPKNELAVSDSSTSSKQAALNPLQSSQMDLGSFGAPHTVALSQGVNGSGKIAAPGKSGLPSSAGEQTRNAIGSATASGAIPGIAAPGTLATEASLPVVRSVDVDGHAGGAESARNPFQAIDSAGVGANSLATLHGAKSGGGLEVGYQDPAMGYVELHAHLAGGAVHASLVAQSAASREVLQEHLGSLSGWLESRRTPVESVTVLAHEDQASSRNGQPGGTAGGGESKNGGANHGSSPNAESVMPTYPLTSSVSGVDSVTGAKFSGDLSSGTLPPGMYREGRISVMA
jgi:hypothetical protein